MDYNLEIKKLGIINGSNHLIDIYNHHLIIYLKHNDTRIKSVLVEEPLNELKESIDNLIEGYITTITPQTYKIK